MARYIVTGGAGFIGSHLTDRLIALGHQVTVLDNLLLGKREFVHSAADFHEVDIRDAEAITPLFVGAEGVFHLAADPRLTLSVEHPLETHAVNVTGTLNVLCAAKEAGVKKVVFTSTCAVYGDQPLPVSEAAVPHPLSPYSLHKLMGEQYCRLFSSLYNLPTVCLRYFNVFGPRKTVEGGYPMVIPVFLRARQEGKPLTIVGDGEQTRDYVHVSDVVEANLKAFQSALGNGEAINIGSGRQVSVREIARLIGGEEVTLPLRAGEMRFIEADTTKAKQLLGWESQVVFEEGIRDLKREWGVE